MEVLFHFLLAHRNERQQRVANQQSGLLSMGTESFKDPNELRRRRLNRLVHHKAILEMNLWPIQSSHGKREEAAQAEPPRP